MCLRVVPACRLGCVSVPDMLWSACARQAAPHCAAPQILEGFVPDGRSAASTVQSKALSGSQQ